MTNPIARIERHDYRDPLGHPMVNDVDWKAITQADKARGEVEREVRYWLDNLPNAIRVREGAGDECLAKSFAVNIAALPAPQPQGDASPQADRMAIRMLVAAGFVTEAKANEALNIAHGFDKGPLTLQVPGGGEALNRLRETLEGAEQMGYTVDTAVELDLLRDAIAALSTPQARPDGGDDAESLRAVAGSLTGPGAEWKREMLFSIADRIATRPAPAPDVALVDAIRSLRADADEARVVYAGQHACGTFRRMVEKLDALLIAAQQEAE